MEKLLNCNDEILQDLTLDEYLGDSSQRYFSANYKKTTHYINDVIVKDNILFASVLVQWPADWSKKKGVSLLPHIGTLDFFTISTILAETYFRNVKNSYEHQIREMWIFEFHCKVGNQCIEENRSICKCELASEISKEKQTEFNLKISIANAKVELKILLPNKNKEIFSKIRQQAISEGDSYYYDCYKNASRIITNIKVYTLSKCITASFVLKHANNSIYNGLGSAYMPCVTLCDLVLVCGQLSQIILYQLDNTTREEASNLWLRNIKCVYTSPIKEKSEVSVKLKDSRKVNLKDRIYNCSDLIFNFNDGNLIAECSAAYQPHEK